MTVFVEGTLLIKSVVGRHGLFNVGKLECQLGEFVVKDPKIDQFEEGKYEGTFELAKIFQYARRLDNACLITELRAEVESITLFEEGQLSPDETVGVQETDPIDDEPTAPPKEREVADPTPSAAEQPDEPRDDEPASPVAQDERLEKLFGHLWPLGNSVRMDMTIDRQLIRQQRDALKAAGYEFDFTSQEWRLLEDA